MNGNPKVIVITGASAGIGAALAELAGRRGAAPVLAARREPELRAVAARCGEHALAVVTNVTQRDDVTRLCEAALERFGRIDVWINNAGRGITRAVSQLTDEDFDEIMRVNVKSALYCMQAVLPHFKAQGRGHIINVSSLLGRIPLSIVRSAYSAAKAALNSLTANLRRELRDEFPEIAISTFLPGVVATEFGISAIGGGVDSRRIPGAQSAEEVAALLWQLIESPRADVYSRPAMREQVAAYYAAEDMATAEVPPVMRLPPPRRD
jgi:NAD(P)-dependent dehydrogenase (short-subunit alcohol dehydrogenase family)